MSDEKFTRGPWKVRTTPRILPDLHYREIMGEDDDGCPVALGEVYSDIECGEPTEDRAAANARLIAAAPDLYEALALYQAWTDSERAGPDYGGQTRDTHPDGERIWRQWWEANLDLCDRAERATVAALAKARGEQ